MSRWFAWMLLLLCLGPVAAMGADTRALDESLTHYRRLVADRGWAALPAGPAVRPGDRHAFVRALRVRLAAEEATPATSSDPERYDEPLARAVREFQRRHGLVADGVVGARTRAALDVPAQVRVAHLERTRRQRLRPAPPRRWIRINVPSFSLAVVDGDTTVLEMPVVVGRPDRPTPLLEGVISSVVVNPSWTVPPDLAHLDLLPKIRRDPRYLASRNIDVYESWTPGARRLDPQQVDWNDIGRGIETLALRQRSGPGNALGHFLIGIADEYDVFLHDTPSRELFQQEIRAFSSGCIRVANARGLVEEILRSDPTWSPERLTTAVASGDTVAIEVRDPMPIRVVYETAWVDGDGVVNFRDDVYAGPHQQTVRARPAPAPRRLAPAAVAPPSVRPAEASAVVAAESTRTARPAAVTPAWPTAPMHWGRPRFGHGMVGAATSP